MDSKIIAAVIVLSILLVVIGLSLPESRTEQSQIFPWQIETVEGGATRVFDLTLGVSTLRDAEARLNSTSEVSLFEESDGRIVAEAYFDKVTLGGLGAKIIAVIAIPPEQRQGMYQRGTRISTLGSGSRKVTLAMQDLERARQSNIASIAYLPEAKLDEELLLKRFGSPAERIPDPEGSVVHWMYPTQGLDISLHSKGRAVLQYVEPARFEQLRRPLSIVDLREPQ